MFLAKATSYLFSFWAHTIALAVLVNVASPFAPYPISAMYALDKDGWAPQSVMPAFVATARGTGYVHARPSEPL